MKRLTLVIGMLGLMAVLAACSNAGSTPGTESVAPSAATGETVTITAKDLAFGQSAVTVPADEAFTVVLDNQEAAPHNVAARSSVGRRRSRRAYRRSPPAATSSGATYIRT
jgi:hypothetical protein